MSKKSLKISLLLFSLCVIGAGVFMIKGKSVAKNLNPVYLGDIEDFTKVELSVKGEEIHINLMDGMWTLTKPVSDWADQNEVKNLLNIILGLSIESVVSENESRYAEFGLTKTDQVQVTIYKNNPPVLVFNGFFGKQALGYSTHYFRFENEPQVRLAYEIPSYRLHGTSEKYRMRRLIPIPFKDLTSLDFVNEENRMTLSKNEAGEWINKRGEPANKQFLNSLEAGYNRFKISSFVVKKGESTERGLKDPVFLIKASTAEKEITVKFGIALPSAPGSEVTSRYAQTEGREAILIVNDKDIDDLKAQIEDVLATSPAVLPENP